MSSIQFHKYQGTGNDFVMIDNRQDVFNKEDLSVVASICDRRFGVGADGVILIEKDSVSDFRMVYYNPDGSQSLCGNGSRCAIMFANYLGIIQDETTFVAFDGLHRAFIKGNRVHLQMHDVAAVETDAESRFVDTGSPHLIKKVTDIENLDVKSAGSSIRYSDRFKENGVNVNFIQQNEGSISIRTYERGVEDETFSCGTGCTAVALSLSEEGVSSPVTLKARGGTLEVSFTRTDKGFKDIYLIGPAEQVFAGKLTI